MPNVIIYHNPRCSKSRQTLELIREQGVEPEIIEYLKQPLKVQELQNLLNLLKISASELVRSKESLFKELKLDDANENEMLAAMAANPVLIERPIVVNGKRACIGRPPENVLEIL